MRAAGLSSCNDRMFIKLPGTGVKLTHMHAEGLFQGTGIKLMHVHAELVVQGQSSISCTRMQRASSKALASS